MSLHQINNVKEPWVKQPTDANGQAINHPDRNRGILPVHVGDHNSASDPITRHAAAVKRALGASLEPVNALFVFFAS
jgi:hypothetical protein